MKPDKQDIQIHVIVKKKSNFIFVFFFFSNPSLYINLRIDGKLLRLPTSEDPTLIPKEMMTFGTSIFRHQVVLVVCVSVRNLVSTVRRLQGVLSIRNTLPELRTDEEEFPSHSPTTSGSLSFSSFYFSLLSST